MTIVAITGATGFVGSALARALAAKGHEIIALVRPGADRSRLRDLPITWHEGDVTDPTTLQGFCDRAEWLVHAAGMLGQAGVPESAYHRLHVEGTRNVLKAATGCRRILYVSSPGVLGPIHGPPADETAPPAPSNPYERSKAAAEEVVLEAAAEGAPVVIARPEFIYGPGDLHVLGLFRAIKRGIFFYVGKGNTVCHPTFIDDAVAGMIHCLEKGRPGEIYHLAGPRPVSFRELAETIAAAMNVRAPRLAIPRQVAWTAASLLELIGRLSGRTPPLTRTGVSFFGENRRFSFEKARRELDYCPQFDLARGVAATVIWYRQQNLI